MTYPYARKQSVRHLVSICLENCHTSFQIYDDIRLSFICKNQKGVKNCHILFRRSEQDERLNWHSKSISKAPCIILCNASALLRLHKHANSSIIQNAAFQTLKAHKAHSNHSWHYLYKIMAIWTEVHYESDVQTVAYTEDSSLLGCNTMSPSTWNFKRISWLAGKLLHSQERFCFIVSYVVIHHNPWHAVISGHSTSARV
jgi:hypothetical protein